MAAKFADARSGHAAAIAIEAWFTHMRESLAEQLHSNAFHIPRIKAGSRVCSGRDYAAEQDRTGLAHLLRPLAMVTNMLRTTVSVFQGSVSLSDIADFGESAQT